MGGFGVDEEIDVGADVFGLGGLELVEVEVDVAAHDDEFFGGAGEGAVEADGGGDVRQRALQLVNGVILFDSSVLEATAYGTINRHLAGVLMHLFHHKLSGAVSFESADIWITLYERGS